MDGYNYFLLTMGRSFPLTVGSLLLRVVIGSVLLTVRSFFAYNGESANRDFVIVL